MEFGILGPLEADVAGARRPRANIQVFPSIILPSPPAVSSGRPRSSLRLVERWPRSGTFGLAIEDRTTPVPSHRGSRGLAYAIQTCFIRCDESR
jgi:hypothetical protein